MPSTREILGSHCGSIDCTAPADRTVVWINGEDRIAEVTFECRACAIESATVPNILPTYRVGAVFTGLRNINV